MRAIVCHTLVGPEGLRLLEVPEPHPGPGQVRIRVHACGVNFADSLITRGEYQRQPPPPFTPGFEVSGEVVELGVGAAGVTVGDCVLAVVPHGGYAEQAVVDPIRCVRLPAGLAWVDAAALPIAFGTAHLALSHRARLRAGERLVVHGAAGGIGLAAVTVGKRLGATVIATASGPDKLAVAGEYGADYLIDTSREDVRARIKELTGGRGADVVFDPVGGDLFDASLRSLDFEGRIVVVGFAAGRVPHIAANHLLVKNVDVIGVNWPAYAELNPQSMTRSLETLLRWLAEGLIRSQVSEVYPLDRAAEAIDCVLRRSSTGKLVLTTER
ncbi:MAG: NADPH:quinone oxidoreductase family protein [Rhodocyclaceae bacterium]|nr:MAG: NADPH:quinone oxidoreductase family protein [Rhodocyclaceae bacterium]